MLLIKFIGTQRRLQRWMQTFAERKKVLILLTHFSANRKSNGKWKIHRKTLYDERY